MSDRSTKITVGATAALRSLRRVLAALSARPSPPGQAGEPLYPSLRLTLRYP